MAEARQYRDPSWWSDSHSSAWERSKAALRRDWEQTKADVSDGGHELNQDVGDTVKQASGKQRIPPGNMPNRPDNWEEVEDALRYGYGARHHYAKEDWNDNLEARLQKDWESSGREGTWDRFKDAVRRGWNSVKRAAA